MSIPRVLFLTSNSSLADGISRHILNICSYLATQKDKVEVAVCITHFHGDLSKELETHGVKVYHLEAPNGHSFKIISRFKQVIDDFGPTVFHAHIMSRFVRISIALHCPKIPIIMTIHGIPDPPSPSIGILAKTKSAIKGVVSKLDRLLLSILFRTNSAHFLYISTACMKQRMVKGKPGEVLFNPIQIPETDLSVVLQNKAETRKRILALLHQEYGYAGSDDVKIIGFVGRLDKVKDLPSFLRVCNLVHDNHPDTLFVIVGCGPDESLKSSEDAVKLGKQLIWTGYRTDARDFISAFDVLLMTSYREGGPIVVLEAFIQGTLVSSFEILGGMQDLITLSAQYKNGVCTVAENRDCQTMAQNVNEMLWGNMDTDIMRSNAIMLLQNHYSENKICGRLIELYYQIRIDKS
ncbi:MAG: glycosyltransferase family 4 protein [Victivallales bacterium]|nr:glycosyltransferase family 4 protein [Victivallales bacterium]